MPIGIDACSSSRQITLPTCLGLCFAVCCWQVALNLKDPWVAATEDLEAFEQLVTEVSGADY
jgi:hypothetical protein